MIERLLLDTHALLWALTSPDKMDDLARDAVSDPRNDIFVSAVSGWEIALKSNLGKLQVPVNVYEMIEATGFTHLPITFAHGVAAGRLPLYHRDPFDRLLIAQAQAEGLVLVTRDRYILQYDVSAMAL